MIVFGLVIHSHLKFSPAVLCIVPNKRSQLFSAWFHIQYYESITDYVLEVEETKKE